VSRRISFRRVAAVGGLYIFAATGAPSPAHAQANNQPAAEALFREARTLLDAGRYAEACEKFAASQRLDPASGTLLNLARCYEKNGQTATAWVTYREAIASAKAAQRPDREKSARERADALEPTLPRLTIVVSPEASAARVQIKRDGVSVSSDLWGVNAPVDPGEHLIEASAPDKKPWSTRTRAVERATVTVTVPPLEPSRSTSAAAPVKVAAVAAPPSDGAKGAASGPSSTQHVEPDAPEGGGWSGSKTAAVILGAVGVGGLVLGGVEWVVFNSKMEDANAACPGACSEAQLALAHSYRDEASTAGNIGIVAGAVGGASLVTATVLWLTSSSASTSKVAIVPLGGARELGVGVGGVW
jgi:hypothetical protein